MANVYSIAFAVVGVIGIHSCPLVWTALLLPGPVDRARRRVESRPVSSFLIGLLCCLLTVAVAGGYFLVRTQSVPRVAAVLQFLSDHLHVARFYDDAWVITNTFLWPLFAPVMAGAIVGGAGFAQLFAARAGALMREDRPLAGLVWGAVCTSAAYFLPFVGWFLFLPIVGLMSVGAGVCGLLGGLKTRSFDSPSVGSEHEGAKPTADRREKPSLVRR